MPGLFGRCFTIRMEDGDLARSSLFVIFAFFVVPIEVIFDSTLRAAGLGGRVDGPAG